MRGYSLPIIGLTLSLAVGLVLVHRATGFIGSFSQAETDTEISEDLGFLEPVPEDPYINWKRPDGPLRVGLQAGHWFAVEAPEEQEGLRDNTGAQVGRLTEWETNLSIAQATKALLEAKGVIVDLLPTTIPPEYSADAFISIHADGNADTSVNGYKIAAPRRDRSGQAERLSQLIETNYGQATGLIIDPNITRNMRGYYAFNWRRYDHSIHPMTPGTIVETGFLTSAKDRRIIEQNPKRAAEGIATGILAFLEETVPEQTIR